MNQSKDTNKCKVLVITDVQRDFFDPSGSLYVKGSELLPSKIAAITSSYDAIIFTLDWHPGNHCSFAKEGGMWPQHCVAYTQGAGLADEFSEILAQGEGRVQFFFKAQRRNEEQYGAFEGISENSVVYSWLSSCESVDICGIAGDYCVKETLKNVLKIAKKAKVGALMECISSIDGGEIFENFISEKGIIRK